MTQLHITLNIEDIKKLINSEVRIRLFEELILNEKM